MNLGDTKVSNGGYGFHGVCSVIVSAPRICGNKDAFAVRDIDLVDADGKKVRIILYSDHGPNPSISVTVS